MMSNSEDFIDIESSKKPRKRLFEAGHMKLLVLHLIAQTPQFSYDIIKGWCIKKYAKKKQVEF